MTLNIRNFIFLVLYPLAILIGFIYYALNFELSWSHFAIFAITYYACNISVGLGFHRLWSHNAYKTNKVVELVLMIFTTLTLQGPVIAWASDHKKHHAFTDEKGDPHSPLKYPESKLKGFLWSHIGWMLFDESTTKHIDPITMKRLGSNPILKFQLDYYWQLAALMNFILPVVIGYLIFGTAFGALTCFLFVGLGRALQQQVTFFVNSACHMVGTKYLSKTTARNVWWLSLLLLGENWHDFHHAFASDYRNGYKWYHFDAHKWLIWGMSKIGLAHDLNITPAERIEAKNSAYNQDLNSQITELLAQISARTDALYENLNQKIIELKQYKSSAKEKLARKMLSLEIRALELKAKAEAYVEQIELVDPKTVLLMQAKFEDLNNKALKLINQYQLQFSLAK